MPDFSNCLQLDDGKWVYDDGEVRAVFEQHDLERILSHEPFTDEKIKEVAAGIKDGSVLCSDQCPPDMVLSVFMILAFLQPQNVVELKLRDISLFYEYVARAGTYGCNGYPSFTSCQMMNKDDHFRLRRELEAIGVFDD